MPQPYPFNQKVASTSLLAQTFNGVPGGMNMALSAYEIDDSQARILVDLLVDLPGFCRQRGPVEGIANTPHLPRAGVGLFATLDPQSTSKYAALTGDSGSGYFTVLSDDGLTWTDLTWPFNLPSAAGTFYIVDGKPALNGGMIIGVASDYGSGTGITQGLAYWFGGNKANYTNTVTGARGSKTVTGTNFTANLSPGMFLFANTDDPYTGAYIGCVASIDSNTSLTLVDGSFHSFTAKSGTFKSLRGIQAQVTTGEITTSSSSTTVTGGATKFNANGLANGTWQIYRQSDGAFIGKVSSVTTDISLTLTANATLDMANEPYVAVQVDVTYPIDTPILGPYNTTYANRQWYAGKSTSFDDASRVWFSDTNNLEGLDLARTDGNWFEVPSTADANEPIQGLASAYSGLLIFKETETFIVSGSSPDSFAVNKLEDDGVISSMSIQQFGGGVIWAGREGINFFDGVQPINLTQNTLGQVWKDTIRTLNPSQYRLWSMLNRDHYFLTLERVDPTFSITKGPTSTSFTSFTIIINMTTRAVSLATNLAFRGATTIPASSGKHAWYLVNGKLGGTGSTYGWVCDGDSLFTETGSDAIVCTGETVGPAMYMESKKFNGGDSMRLKRWKMVALNYLAQGGDITVDTVLGLNEVGEVASTNFPQSVPTWTDIAQLSPTWTAMATQYPTWSSVVASVFKPARVRMQKKSQFLAFRLYGATVPLSAVEIGPYQIAFKPQRVGRV